MTKLSDARLDLDAYRDALDARGLDLAGTSPEPFSHSKTSNWVAKAGGLPTYIQHVAHDILESATSKVKDVSSAIAIAISQTKKRAAAGNKQAVAALAQWEKMRAATHAKAATKSLSQDERDGVRLVLAVEALAAQADQGLLLSQAEIDGLQLATFDETKHPRLKGRFVKVGHVLEGKGGGHYRVDKIDAAGAHVRQLRTTPGQTSHDPEAGTMAGIHTIPAEKMDTEFKRVVHAPVEIVTPKERADGTFELNKRAAQAAAARGGVVPNAAEARAAGIRTPAEIQSAVKKSGGVVDAKKLKDEQGKAGVIPAAKHFKADAPKAEVKTHLQGMKPGHTIKIDDPEPGGDFWVVRKLKSGGYEYIPADQRRRKGSLAEVMDELFPAS